MASPIPYTVKSGENLQDIAKNLGIKDWTLLKDYHKQNGGEITSDIPYAGFTLLTPPEEEVFELNGETPPLDPAEEQTTAEQKQEEEKKKEDKREEDEKLEKGEHNGKYFVVHNAKCVCNMAEDSTKTANLQVTSQKIIVFNDQTGKFVATEEDKTFNPAVVTFGKCTLKPSSSGNLPCSVTPAPKWSKTYESTKVEGKNTLTEISELQCMIGGKITINKHGQTDSVSTAHADNTDPLELAMVNPAVEMPKKKEEFPSVSSISITEIEDRKNFKEQSSKDMQMVYLRKDEEASFRATLSKGNTQLTSWMVYSDHTGSKENRLLVREQIGTEFSQSFGELGKFRVEGYGKPKKPNFENGKYDKCDATCSIDIEVVENELVEIETPLPQYFTRIDNNKKVKFRQNFPADFKASFKMSKLSADEKSRLKMYILDGAGNIIPDAIQNGVDISFVPKNSKANYSVVAEYIKESGEKITKQIAGESEANTVVSISHSVEIVHPGTSLQFKVQKMRYDFVAGDPGYDITAEEMADIKWNLDGVLIGTGNSISIPGNMLMTPKKYVVEAFCKVANATGKGSKDEEDDWRFEVKENDVHNFSLSASPKVGKKITATVDKMVFAELQQGETIHWQAMGLNGTGKTISFIPRTAGKFPVNCKINNRKGITKEIEVLEAKIRVGFWHDLQGNEISKATWGQKVCYSVGGDNLKGEKINFKIIDNDKMTGNDFADEKSVLPEDAPFTYFTLELNQDVRDNTTSSITPNAALFTQGKINEIEKEFKDLLPRKGTEKFLEVTSNPEVYRAIIGDQNGKARHNPVDYDMKSFVYTNTTYQEGTKLKVKIYENINWKIDPPCKELEVTGTVQKDGVVVTEVNWGKLNDARHNKKTKKYYAVIYDEEDDKLFDGSHSATLCNTVLIPQSILQKQVGYTGALIVGSKDVEKIENENGVCECEARVRAFMRMLRIGEGTKDEGGYTRIVGGSSFADHKKDFSDHPKVYIKTYDSTAAGAYQITKTNWNENPLKSWRETDTEWLAYKKKYNLESFSKKAQDAYGAFLIIKKKNAFEKIKNGDVEGAIIKCGKEWASLPGAGYGQREEDLENLVFAYEELLKEELSGKTSLHIETGFLKELFGENCCNAKPYLGSAVVNEFGLVQVTKLGNPYIKNNDVNEDSYSYTKKDGTKSVVAKHGDDWMLPEKAQAFSDAVYNLIKEFPNQSIVLNDCSAFNPGINLGYASTGAHSNGNAFDCRFLTADGVGTSNINNLSSEEIKLNARFIAILKETGHFKTFYSAGGKIPGSIHASGHADHIHGN